MDDRELQIIEIPFSQPNEFGVTVRQNELADLKIKFPVPREGELEFGTFLTLFNTGYPIYQVLIRDPQSMPTEFVIKCYDLRCCWQQLYYTFQVGLGDLRTSKKLNVLFKHK